MNVENQKIIKYLNDIKEKTIKIETILKERGSELHQDEVIRLALKFLVIEVAEAIANILQHILANQYGIAAKGYIDIIKKYHPSLKINCL